MELKSFFILTFMLLVTFLSTSSAQKRSKRVKTVHPRYSGQKSPFTKSDQEDTGSPSRAGQPAPRSHSYPEVPGLPKKSPFSRPEQRDKNSYIVTTTSRPVYHTPKKPNARNQGVFNNNKQAEDQEASPFKPPVPDQWRQGIPAQARPVPPSRTHRPVKPPKAGKPVQKKRPTARRAESTLDRPAASHRQNIHGLPSLDSIDVQPRRPALKHQGAGRRRSKPLVSPYEDSPRHGDIHEAGPGETPWTRYTAKPRLSQADAKPQSANARCGNQRYSPRKMICCQGKLVRRQGVKPSCCGQVSYDKAFKKCCNGLVLTGASAQGLNC